MQYTVVLEQSEEGYAVSVPDLPGCHSQGDTEQEALKNISDAISEYLSVSWDNKLILYNAILQLRSSNEKYKHH